MAVTLGYGAQPRAAYAVDPQNSRGRLFQEEGSPTRTPYQRDRDRIIHSTAFRRLKHKTQVFVYHEGDHYRTRLTHTLEVAQIARSLARALRLDEDLAECLALAHDLGHTPFGHEGEDVLDACMQAYGGFDHNAQSLRIVTELECRYAEFDGLNLTWETLEGLAKHNGPLTDKQGRALGKFAGKDLPFALETYAKQQDLQLWSWPSSEAQVAAIADDIAYDAHDIDDGLRAGLLNFEDMRSVPFLRQILEEIDQRYPNLEDGRRVHEVVRRCITNMVVDVIEESVRRLETLAPYNCGDIRRSNKAVVSFSSDMSVRERELKEFLFANLYRHPNVLAVRKDVAQIIQDLFSTYFKSPSLMPGPWNEGLENKGETFKARRVCDFIAGMTDRYAIDEHRRLFDDTPELR
ncbi:deoxyguanosinetriphosphate triphosphohydrolase [Flexibacterium corallicola]|uniref:deoxyguanosinetriphosphate triphosphohydrolase n=1 Tax=Flexibacterium corallicola TaxID=3037259 RepID=UPI00286F8508|nr:deoxyguanosinetriphosphate triphosphohydrolase [Pseudovibrio sp. M1P-2-3]